MKKEPQESHKLSSNSFRVLGILFEKFETMIKNLEIFVNKKKINNNLKNKNKNNEQRLSKNPQETPKNLTTMLRTNLSTVDVLQ